MMIQAVTFSRVCQINNSLLDDDWAMIMYIYSMRYSEESLREGFCNYWKHKQDDEDLLDELRMAGYTEEDIARRR